VNASISIFACESQPIVVEGLRKALEDYEDLQFLGSVPNNNDALETLCQARPDIALIDLSGGLTRALRLVGGLKTVSEKSHPVLWVVDLPEGDALRALQMGVRGIVKKTLPIEKLVECLREVGAGKIWTDEAEPVIEFLRGKESARLTPRERQIVALICRGMKNKQIAENLHITPGTVKVHLMHIFEKTGLKHRLALAVHGRELIGPERWFEESVKS
jgi:two-component system nitrate/nitrite response regulator NarL